MLISTASMPLYSSGSSGEAAAPSTRVVYLSRKSIITRPSEVYFDSYIASVDYRYPFASEALGITMYSGHRQISTNGQEEVIQIGIQGGKAEFEDLPPMNLAFVIDRSASMREANKMRWVKNAFDIFVEKVRDIDFVSLVVFNGFANVIYPSTQMNSDSKREEFKDAVRSIRSWGGTNLFSGLQLGYQQVMANYREEYINRVLFLTDGIGSAANMLEMAENYKSIGVNISTIGVGTDFELPLMQELAKKGGGSSRFISDRETMAEIFGSELDRMVVPSAYNLEMLLRLPYDVQILGTWGYNSRIKGNTITYSHDTLHNGDYETILVHLRIPAGQKAGRQTLAQFSISYDDINGRNYSSDNHELEVEYVRIDSPA